MILGGSFLEGLIHGGAYFQNFTVLNYKLCPPISMGFFPSYMAPTH